MADRLAESAQAHSRDECPEAVWCEAHDGSPWLDGRAPGDECGRCEGTGDLYGRSVGPIAICPDCNGSGRVIPSD